MTAAIIGGIVVAALCCALIAAAVYGAEIIVTYSRRCERCGRWVDHGDDCACE